MSSVSDLMEKVQVSAVLDGGDFLKTVATDIDHLPDFHSYDLVGTIGELKLIIHSLCSKIALLEERIEQQTSVVDKLLATSMVQQTTEQTTRGNQLTKPSYAAALKSKPVTTPSNRSSTQTKKSSLSCLGPATAVGADKKPIIKEKNRANDVKSNTSHFGSSTKGKECISKVDVVILHDSILNGVQPGKLGLSYGFEAVKCKAPSINELESGLQSASLSNNPNAVLIHCGINNLRTQDPRSAAKQFVQTVKKISSSKPAMKIVISKLPTISDVKMRNKKEIFNALVFSELVEEKNISFVNHYNLPLHELRDGIHPTRRGSSILASNIGRHLHRLLWEKQRTPARRFNHADTFPGYYDWKGNFFPHSPIVFPTKWY